MNRTSRKPHRVDAIVGANLRRIRLLRGLSQEALAKQLGLTFQQLQKYEKGANRISASKLWELSTLLEVGVQDFFASVEEPAASEAVTPVEDAIIDFRKDEIDLLRLFRTMPPEVTARVRDLLRATAEVRSKSGQGATQKQ